MEEGAFEGQRLLLHADHVEPSCVLRWNGAAFEPFQQLTPSNARSAPGFGLGLAVVKAVADVHGARVSAYARPGGGLRIEVAFPLATQPRNDAAPP